MNYDENGDLILYDFLHPRYPIFHDSDKTLSILWTDYNDDFKTFYEQFISDVNQYGEKRSMAAKGQFPPNCFDMSCLPWSSFTSFDCPPTKDTVWLPPFVMVGKFYPKDDKILLPFSLTLPHFQYYQYLFSVYHKIHIQHVLYNNSSLLPFLTHH